MLDVSRRSNTRPEPVAASPNRFGRYNHSRAKRANEHTGVPMCRRTVCDGSYSAFVPSNRDHANIDHRLDRSERSR